MIFNHLTESDQSNIQNWINLYGLTEYGPETCAQATLETVLYEWNKCKEDLFHKFNDHFIISEHIEYEESYSEIEERINRFWDDPELSVFATKLRNIYPYHWDGDDYQNSEHRVVDDLLSSYTLRKNSFSKDPKSFYCKGELILKDGSKFRIQKDMKPMKILKKLANSYGIEGFEAFRNFHSRCLQTKKISGELCFSIHPLDYLTMSDNDYGWTSCMSFRNDGCYRLGTIEMMNSPVVVMAYLKGEEDMVDHNVVWNNKKWRCLFIVNNDFVFSIKQYPCANKNLVKFATSRLADIMRFGNGQEPTEYRVECYNYSTPCEIGDKKFYVSLTTNAMYNDCGRCKHWVIINQDKEDHVYDDYNYSGVATCLHCGEVLNWQHEYENCTTCGMLADIENNYYWCEECNCRLSEDDVYWVDSTALCGECFDNEACVDRIHGTNLWQDEAIKIYLSKEEDHLCKT